MFFDNGKLYDQCIQICEAIKRGEDVAEMAAAIEPQIKRYYKAQESSGCYYTPYDYLTYAEDALYDVSPRVKRHWENACAACETPEGRYNEMLRFVNTREKYLGIPHAESIKTLRTLGFTAADVMAAFLESHCTNTRFRPLSPDVVAEAAKEDMDTALLLLNGKDYERFFPRWKYFAGYHYDWINFMYFFMEYGDYSFLTQEHKRKKVGKFCQEVLAKLEKGAAKLEASPKASNPPDFSVFNGILLKQQHLIRSAGGQRLRKGNDNNGYYVMSYHLVDEEHGCGAALCFDPLNKAPEYDDETAPAEGVFFYRFNHLYLSDYVPESLRQLPQEMPQEFVKKAYRAFSMAAGLTKK